jgi:glucokinase
MNLRQVFERSFGIVQESIVFLNDAQAFLIGECHAGAAKRVGRCIGLTLGTGVGSAFSIDGAIADRGTGIPPVGEIYCLPWEGRTIEDTISTRAIQEGYRRLEGKTKSVREICEAAPKDRAATLAMHDFGNNLGSVLKDTCMAFHPEAIVLGGAISRNADLFLPSALTSLGEHSGQLLRVSDLFDDAPLVGAAVRCLEVVRAW